MRRLLTYSLAGLLLTATMGAAPAANTNLPGSATPGSQSNPVNQTPARQNKTKRRIQDNPFQVGKASWYGRQFHGKTTASGEPFNMFNLTAAHRSLPLGSWVKVTNVRNGASVIVRINDRGPVPAERIIDLSYEAATLLGIRDNGLGKVRLDLVDPQTMALALRAEQIFN